MQYKIGDIVQGRITGIQPYGAFVSIDEENQGLIHISEVQSGFTKNVHQSLKVDQTVSAQVIDIDDFSNKLSLSLRSLEKYPLAPAFCRKKYFSNPQKNLGFSSVEKKLPEWIEEAISYF